MTWGLTVHAWLGLKFISRAWLDLEVWWAGSLIVIGFIALASAVPFGPE